MFSISNSKLTVTGNGTNDIQCRFIDEDFTEDSTETIPTVIIEAGTYTINNGTFTSNASTIMDIEGGNIVINNGTFESSGCCIDYEGISDDEKKTIKLIINGGRSTATNDIAIYAYTGDVKITGGDFKGTWGGLYIDELETTPKEVQSPVTQEVENKKDETPKTGNDNNIIGIVTIIACLSVLEFIATRKRK